MHLVALDLAGDARHGRHRLRRVLPGRGLVAQHHGIHPFVDRTGHVAHLGPRRTRRMHHRVEHLRGDDHGALGRDALLHDAALRPGNGLGGQLDAQVAARHHHAVRGLDDLVDMVQTLLILDLRDDLDRTVVLVQNGLHGLHVAGAPHEGVGDEIDVVPDGPFDEAAVLLRHRRQVERHARHVHALAREQPSARDEATGQLLVVLVGHHDLQLTVGDEHVGAHRHVGDHAGGVHIDQLARGLPAAVRAAHLHQVAGLEVDGSVVLLGNGRHPHLGALRIQNDRNGAVHPVHRLHDPRRPLFGRMGRIDADDVHARVVKALNVLLRTPAVRNGRDDLRLFHSQHISRFIVLLRYPPIRPRAIGRVKIRQFFRIRDSNSEFGRISPPFSGGAPGSGAGGHRLQPGGTAANTAPANLKIIQKTIEFV